MRILLVAYEFPPSRAPRALRWRSMACALARCGHELHVLAPDVGAGTTDASMAAAGIRVHRVFPGPLAWALAHGKPAKAPAGEVAGPAGKPVLNWKGQVAGWLKRMAGMFLFPDARSEWLPWARRELDRLIVAVRPDVVVTSHEPANTLVLGRWARHRGSRWVADLGDPVLTAYTPRRWRRRALALEAATCREADHIVVTNGGALELLSRRHGLEPERCSVIPQGYDDAAAVGGPRVQADGPLELLFSGRLYGFRDPRNLLQALARVEGVRLTLVLGDPAPAGLLPASALPADRVRVLGPLPHGEVLHLQREADVLLNIGNQNMPGQIPGKFYEYLGAGRPILHLAPAAGDDVAADFIRESRRGWVCADDSESLAAVLADLALRKRNRLLDASLDLSPPEGFAVSSLARRLSGILEGVARD